MVTRAPPSGGGLGHKRAFLRWPAWSQDLCFSRRGCSRAPLCCGVVNIDDKMSQPSKRKFKTLLDACSKAPLQPITKTFIESSGYLLAPSDSTPNLSLVAHAVLKAQTEPEIFKIGAQVLCSRLLVTLPVDSYPLKFVPPYIHFFFK